MIRDHHVDPESAGCLDGLVASGPAIGRYDQIDFIRTGVMGNVVGLDAVTFGQAVGNVIRYIRTGIAQKIQQNDS
jgi:hypothetical protein